MKQLLILCVFLCPLLAGAQVPQAIEADRVIAVVNSEAITQYDLRTRLATIERQLKKQGTPLPPAKALERQVLERIIMDRIQLQLAAETGNRVGEAELDAAMERVAVNNKLTVEEFKAAVEKDGISWTRLREEVRQEITLGQLRDREVNRRISISEGEIDNYLAAAAARAENPEYTMAHIIVRLPEEVDADKIARLRSKAEEALKLLQRGEDFAKIAATYSDAPDALSGGLLGARPADRLPTLYADALKTLNPGQISGILRSAAGFHIVKLIDKRGGKPALPAQRQTRAKHILIKVSETVSDAEAKRKIETIKERLDAGGDFEEQAKLHSNDLSAPKGGDLGWMNQGATVPPFEKAMDALPLNKISDPVRTQFGWHLILVVERKQDDGSEERLRQTAKQVLLERKADDALQDWLRQLRDRAYVEYRTEER